MKKTVIGLVLAGTLAFGGIASATPHATPAREYAIDATAIKGALTRWSHEVARWNGATSAATIAREATPIVIILETVQARLLNQRWPAVARRDVRRLYSALSPIEADLITVSGVTTLSAGQWAARYATDVEAMVSDVRLLRHDL